MCLHCDDPDAGAWEHGGLYKSCLLELDGVFHLFYNAKNHMNWPWIEQTGVAISTDLKQWRRVAQQPVLTVGAPGTYDDLFASDPCVLRCDDAWALFYFGNSSDGHARDSVAFSTDLLHWDKCGEVLVDVGPAGAIDSRHAHKPSMFLHAGRLYHFYCAVAPAAGTRLGEIDHDEIRGIAVSTNA
ncbi:MAG: hypothetical protein M1546_21295 [Chloroflexi bacterium]|nr:hypothetical protein [Chloroflexota bacterium]